MKHITTIIAPEHDSKTKHMMKLTAVLTLMLLCGLQSTTGQVRISEFSAFNSSTLADEEGSQEDWIELVNLGSQTINLNAWNLTDDAQSLRKWTFPSVLLSPGNYLVIFASGKDRRAPERPLHTNFRLSADGEFLALVNPDLEIVSNAFSPSYPQQFRDVSFGFGLEQSTTVLVASTDSGRMIVPRNGKLDLSWTTEEFDDARWPSVSNGLGFDTGELNPTENSYPERVLATEPALYWRLDESTGSIASNLGSLADSGQGQYQGSPNLGKAGPRPPDFADFDIGNRAPTFDGNNDYVTGPRGLLNDRAAFTMAGWIRPTSNQTSRTGLWGQNDAVEFGFINNSTLQLWTPVGSVNTSYGHPLNEWHHVTAMGTGTALQIYLDGKLAAESDGGSESHGRSRFAFNAGGGGIFDATGNSFEGQMDEISFWSRALEKEEINDLIEGSATIDFAPYIATDITESMHGINSSVYVRFPFTLEDPSTINQLLLRIRHDDGFVAWVNGFESARNHAPEVLSWNANATQSHPDNQAVLWEEFDLSGSMDTLVAGRNILALQGLNKDTLNSDFLMQAELVAIRHGETTTVPRYFTEPSPGQPNGAGGNMGPVLSQATHTPEQPHANEALKVTVQASSAIAPVDQLQLRYRVQFGSEKTLNMQDTGQFGDVTAKDGIWTATIPAQAAEAGELIRYYVTATDTDGNSSRWPLYPESRDSEAYQGTTVIDPSIQSTLPVVQLFIRNISAANTSSGTRASLYYAGELYDNLHISIHGQSSRGFPKKSYNLDFTSDHRFQYRPGERRVKDIRLMTNWGDKSRVRNALAYEMIQQSGSLGHFSFQVRIQRNAEFFSIADMMEDGDDRWLERVGRNPDGALYKMYNNLGSASGNEKKTRRWEGTSDLQTLVSALNEGRSLAQRTHDAWDIIDLPQTISYCVALALCSSQDHGHKNYYLYRDSESSDEWALLPWDVDLSWGRNWLDSRGYFTDTLFQNNELDFYNASQQGKPSNRLYELMFDAPAFRAMVLRRLRTVMDTLLQAPETPGEDLIIEKRILEMVDAMDPPGAGTSDADLDFQRWGSWGNRNEMREEAERILSIHLPGRREFLFQQNPRINRDTIPTPQPHSAAPHFGAIEFNPSSGNQEEEYVELINPNAFAIDLSGWKIEGGVRHTFRPGTVIPGNHNLYISPDVSSFRSRATRPTGGQGLFVQGNYEGKLNARGETLQLVNTLGETKASHSFEGRASEAQQQLRITEIFYHPDPVTAFPYDPEEYEFIELTNTGTTPLDLHGIRLSSGILFNFTDSPVTSLAPGAFVVVVRNPAAFKARYGTQKNIAGEFKGALNNGGETLRLEDAGGEKILEFAFDNSWLPVTDGLGFSLSVVDENRDWNLWGASDTWLPSAVPGGSPGEPDPMPNAPMGIVINEILAHTDLPQLDAVELWNPTDSDIQVGGWFLTDDFSEPKKYQIPATTSLNAGDYLVFTEADFNQDPEIPNAFALGSQGDEVYLFATDNQGRLLGTHHGFAFGASPNGASFGLHRTSDQEEHFILTEQPTLGSINTNPMVGPWVISEIMYHPPKLPDENISNELAEFIEIENISGTDQALHDPDHPENRWQLRGAVVFDFPEMPSLQPNSRLLIVGFNPADPALLSNFRSHYQIPDSILVTGPWEGKLNHAGEALELMQPDSPDPGNVPYILVDKVAFDDAVPWPVEADGSGSSLQRRPIHAYGNDPAHWFAGPPTPGTLNALNLKPTVALIEPTAGAIFDRPVDIALSAVATDPDGEIDRVSFYNHEEKLGEDSTTPYTWIWKNAPAGHHLLTARAQDDRLGFHTSESASIEIRSQPPTIVWSQPGNGEVVGTGIETPLRVEAEDSDSKVMQVTYYANGLEIGTVSQRPYSISWIPSETGTYSLQAEVVDETGTSHPSEAMNVYAVTTSQEQHILVARDAPWRYLDNGQDPGAAWLTPAFNENAWKLGEAELGYGDGDEATVISFGPSNSSKFTTSWFRHTFTLGEDIQPITAELRIVRDDGVIAYLNGTEVFRDNLPEGNILPSTRALGAISGNNESDWLTTSIPVKLFNKGSNVLAIEMHQANGASSDISFNAECLVVESHLAPFIRSEPDDLNLTTGQNVSLKADVEGSVPLSYQWYFNGAPVTNEDSSVLTLQNIQPVQSGIYQLHVSNTIGTSVGREILLTVSGIPVDSDGDGLPDTWELAHGLDPQSHAGAHGADGDWDFDGATNWEEYQSGTIPNDATSLLRLILIRNQDEPEIFELIFEAKAGKSYLLESASLKREAWWNEVRVISATSADRTIQTRIQTSDGIGQLYRVRLSSVVPAP